MTSMEVVAFLVKRLDVLVEREVVIDDVFFRLHHGWTCPTLFLFVFTSLLYRLLEPISCMATTNALSEKTLNAYCLMQNTFVLPDEIAKNIGAEVSHQGIDKLLPGQPKAYQKYYQWVPILLLAQAVLFYATRFFWEKKEKGITRNLLVNLDQPILRSQGGEKLMSDEDAEGRAGRLAAFLESTRGQYRSYFYVYAACTVANLANACLQIVFTDMFLGASFFENGWRVLGLLNADYGNRTDPMVAIFPRVAKCQFQQFGVAGSVQTHDVLCVLPFNFFYEMIFVYNLVWFSVLALASLLGVLFWAANWVSLRARVKSLEIWKPTSGVGAGGGAAKLRAALEERDVGDWFLLRLLAVNMSANHYGTLLGMLPVDDDDDDTFEPIVSKKGDGD